MNARHPEYFRESRHYLTTNLLNGETTMYVPATVSGQDQGKELLVKAQQGRFLKNVDYSGLDIRQDDDGDIAVIDGQEIPLLDVAFNIKIVQPGHVTENKVLKDHVAKILVIYDENDPTQESTDHLNLAPITIVGTSMRNFGNFDSASSDKKLLCYSNDGIVPADRVEVPLNPCCAEIVMGKNGPQRKVVCPEAVWEDGNKPCCREEVTVAFFDMDRKIPILMRLHGTAIGAWNALQRSYRTAKNVARLKRKSIGDYFIELTVDYSGTYVTPVFTLKEGTAETGKSSDYTRICKYYMEKLFMRAPEETPAASSSGAVVTQAQEAVVASAEEEDASERSFMTI